MCIMTFRSKVDTFFKIIFLIILIIFLIIFLVFLFNINTISHVQYPFIWKAIVLVTFVISYCFLLWVFLSVKYIFNKDHLLLQGGPFKNRISYDRMVKVVPTNSVLTGQATVTSRDALEIYYKDKVIKSIKVSPQCKNEFISLLKKLNPNLKIIN